MSRDEAAGTSARRRSPSESRSPISELDFVLGANRRRPAGRPTSNLQPNCHDWKQHIGTRIAAAKQLQCRRRRRLSTIDGVNCNEIWNTASHRRRSCPCMVLDSSRTTARAISRLERRMLAARRLSRSEDAPALRLPIGVCELGIGQEFIAALPVEFDWLKNGSVVVEAGPHSRRRAAELLVSLTARARGHATDGKIAVYHRRSGRFRARFLWLMPLAMPTRDW